jgi:hypothetical protein
MPAWTASLDIVEVEAQTEKEKGKRKEVVSVGGQTGGQASAKHSSASEDQRQDSSGVGQKSENDGPDT